MQKLFISLPGKTTYTVYEHAINGEVGFVFTAFNKKSKVSFTVAQTEDESFEPHLREDILKPHNLQKEQYLNLLQRTIAHIKEEQLGKIVVSRAAYYLQPINPVSVFKKLVKAYPSACVYLLTHPKAGTWMGATPELLLKSEDEAVSSMSLAGTRKKGEESGFTDKEVHEQQMVTDFIYSIFLDNPNLTGITKNDPQLHEAGNLVHFKTEIKAQLQRGFQVLPFVKQLHPTPAVAGFPRMKALEFIAGHEGYDREFYAGFFGLKGRYDFQFFVNLRCMQIFDNSVVLYAGGGITKDSDPTAEWEETEDKLQTLLKVLQS